MSDNKLILNHHLIHIFPSQVSREQAIRELAALLQAGGFVKESFTDAVIAREQVFPTGLPTQPVGIAIPHTDSEHVNRGAIAVGILVEPVTFNEMGDLEATVDVSIINVLAIPDPKAVVSTLSALAHTFQKSGFLERLSQAKTASAVAELYKMELNDLLEIESIDPPTTISTASCKIAHR